VPHEGLIEELDAVGPEHLGQRPQLCRVGELLRVEGDGTLSRQGYEGSIRRKADDYLLNGVADPATVVNIQAPIFFAGISVMEIVCFF
jgi:hypothetical protein